ncbi:RHS repeat domain-containing protein [Xenorhabdus hominickii]|uniref:YD repeat n=1 Tax=Xenorhabdus hominickii TaxID=351679 RepID=A0A2G0QAL9_XENHO|nr:RHS repeat-associated core domain-containing protein [Xenorhabdus hominickii]AOM40764.1 hypothetical protein A9255_09260 [Xenorhabdus hominickii]PHM56287.1 YD repeat [Xenorhabdus hominickii]
MNNSFFSNAHNFQSAAMGSVDPRTGLFSYTMLVAQLTGNNHLGPTQTIALSYSPLNTKDIGFGIGFAFSLTQYDKQNRLLVLSTGERYKVAETDNAVFLEQYKQDVVRFEKDVAQDVYRVIHKSGMVEVLNGPQNAYDLKVPIQIFTPLGHTLTLNWAYGLGPIPYLKSISDEENELLQVHYELGSYTRITVRPNTTESYNIQLLFNNGYVSEVNNDAVEPLLKWTMRYDADCRFLTQVLSPTGLTEHVVYTLDGHQFPGKSGLPPLPYVVQYTQYPGHGPNIERTYQYTTSTNFLGYGEKEDWDRDEDYLYGILADYQYGSTESWDDGTTQHLITRRYNNYHLLVSEMVQQNGKNECNRLHQTEYYAQVGVEFQQQPPQFQMPKLATVCFNGKSDGEVTQTEFDAAGNPTMQISSDGVRTDWIYYPAEGDGDDCPASPYGFVRFVKSKTVTPGRSSPEGAYEDAPVYQTVYRYSQLPTCNGAPASYAVVRTCKSLYSAGQLLHESRIQYVNAVNSPEHGRIQRIEETLHATSEAASFSSASTWTSQQTFSYTIQGDTLVQDIEYIGYDQLSLNSQYIQSRFSGKLWREVNSQQCISQYHYDELGRLLKYVSNAETDYAQEVHYSYTIEGIGEIMTTKTDMLGNQLRTRFDGLGRSYQQEILEKGQEAQGWRVVSEIERDNWGRVVKQTRYDWLPMDNDEGNSVPVSSSQYFEYDDWGQQYRIIKDTGESTQQDYDPVTRTLQITLQAPGLKFSKRTVVYDKCHRPVTTTFYDSQGNQHSQQINHYDGLGRLRATVDELKQKTEYTYDLFGRINSTTHSDGTVVRKSFAPFSLKSLVTQVKANDHVLGVRNFDSLHRIISTTSGERTYQYTYQGKNSRPSQITDPLGNTITYSYDPLQGNVLTQVDAGGIQQRFAYDPKTGVITQASAAQQATHSLSYTSSGRLQQGTFRFDDAGAGAARQEKYTYSPAGQLTAYQDVTGKIRRVNFDKFGRPVAALDPDIDVHLTYDTASRVNSWRVHDKQHDKLLTVTLGFDDFGREINREIQTEKDTLTLEQIYTTTGQIATRATRSQHTGLLRQESYTYDPARHWLTEYDCAGSEQPLDAYGFGIAHQHFTYDCLGNILTCITTLADGSSDTATFAYSSSDPCQLRTITHTHLGYPATIILEYDKAGRLIQDEGGRHLTYDALGRLADVRFNDTTSDYTYDAFDRLVLQQIDADNTREFYYQGEARVTEILRESGAETRLLHAQGTTVATVTGSEAHLLGTDHNSSVLMSYKSDGIQTHYRYSPYGQQAEKERNPAIPAYNGEQLDPIGGTYHLGNGYRAYNPVLMRFNAPDSWSPFGAGGLNAYAYCLGDPINRIDPTGHMSLSSVFGIAFCAIGLVAGLTMAIPTGGASLSMSGAIFAGIGLLSDVTGIASAATEDNDPHASTILGWISLGLGVIDLGAGSGGIIKGILQMKKTPAAFGEVFASEVVSYEFTPRGMNMAPPRGYMGNDYVIALQSAIRDERIVSVENPAGSGIHTVGFETTGLYPASRDRDLDLLRRAIFRPSGSNSSIDIVNNIHVAESGVPHNLNITSEDFERLYLDFISIDILSPINKTESIVSTINEIRSITISHLLNTTELSDNTINMMRTAWRNGAFSQYSLEDWICNMLLTESPRTELLLRQNLRDNNESIHFFNNIIIPDRRG